MPIAPQTRNFAWTHGTGKKKYLKIQENFLGMKTVVK